MDDKRLWGYVLAVVVAVILIIIALAVRKRDYSKFGISSQQAGMILQGGALGFVLFLVILGFMTYASYRVDLVLDPYYQNIFRAFWAAQLILLILYFFAYRSTGIAALIALFLFLLNVALFFYIGFLTQNGSTVPLWCYAPYVLATFMILGAAAGARSNKWTKEVAHTL